MTYQSFGLDKKIDKTKLVDLFGGDNRTRTCDLMYVKHAL